MENSLEKAHVISLSIGQMFGWAIAIFTILISFSYYAGSYNSQFETMKQDINEGKQIGKELNSSVQQLTIEVKSLRQEMNNNANQRRTATEKR
ncbi:hypothetical protein UFOVP434_47 [uncultured Caudovirales phage]|uniref:Uncharacterized protein n=1 Tax=uncultured Caudovirales phage TaxID=2100421 RepID=A0A6J5MC53_9CAUD|nr:hypothetical protein UFOVP434_47 [uncultured Caudovirales phage]